MHAWLERGGRLMYLGANGWYWRIAFHASLPGVIEVRRAEGGIRTWAAEPGEYYHSFTGEFGGLWRRIGRPPNVVVGLGFIRPGLRSQLLLPPPAGQLRPARRLHLRGRRGRDHRRFRPDRRRRCGPRARPRRPRARHAAKPAACSPRPRTTRRSDPGRGRGVQRHDARISAARRTSWSAPTSPSSRRPRAAPSSPRARSPGAARSRTTATPTTSPGSPGTCSAASSTRRRSGLEFVRPGHSQPRRLRLARFGASVSRYLRQRARRRRYPGHRWIGSKRSGSGNTPIRTQRRGRWPQDTGCGERVS